MAPTRIANAAAAAVPITCDDGFSALFAPRSVAVVGASSDPLRFGGKPIRYMRDAAFAGPIYPINPTRAEIQGLRAYASLEAVDGDIDCALLAVSTEATEDALRACIDKGVKAAVLYGAGFSEMGAEGAARQDRLVRMATDAGLRLLGPNCMGLLNTRACFYGTFASALEEGVPAPGRIGVASQSGGYGGYLMKHLFRRGLGISQWVTTGNEADIDVGEALYWMAGQEETDLLLVYLEGLRSKDNLIAAFERARRNHKPVVVMKVGRTAEGATAAASHTASLTGEDSVYDAVFETYGVHRARTTDDLLDVAYALSKRRPLRGRRIGVVSISGGVGVQIADFVSDAALVMGETPDATQATLRALVPNCSPRNPIDMTGLVTTNHEIMEKTLDAVLGSGAFDATVIFLGIAGAAPSMARPLQQAITNAYARFPDQLVSVSVTTSEEMAREFDAKGLLTFEDPSRVIKALAALARFEETFASPAPERHSVAPAAPLALPADGKLNEADAKALLARAGVRSPRETLVASPEAAADAAAAIGFPVALKVVSPDILHKTEYGGVALGLATADAVAEAVRRMQATIPARLPDARIDGYLVSEMVSGGVECIVGVARDPAFGPVVTVGLGGVLVELIKDTVCGVAPISEAQAATMIARLKTYPLLAGYRGGPRHDVAALAQAISALSRLAVQHADQIETLEVNPLIVRIEGRGVIALDAVVEIAKG